MNRPRSTLALAALLPLTLWAAEAPPAAERPFESVRQDLGALKTTGPGGVAPSAGLDLGVAAGIGGTGNFSAPPAVAAPARKPETATTSQPKSSGWLLDAMEENSRKAGSGPGRDGNTQDGADGEPERTSGATTKDASGRAASSTLPTAVSSPLSSYMADWLSPDEFRRLGTLYPELTGSGPATEGLRGPDALRRPDAIVLPAAGASAGPLETATAAAVGRPEGNPFIQAMQAPPRVVVPVAPVEPPRPVVSLPSSVGPATVSEPARTAPTRPEAPGADDRKYYPQLKRF